MIKLSFPLYHATSSIFIESIKQFGLGGKNPVNDLRAIELLKELEVLADKELSQLEDWGYFKNVIERLTGQSSKLYQHNSAYLTPSLYQASNYSKNKYGSEFISETFRLIILLKREHINIPNYLINEYKDLFNLEMTKPQPVVYALNNLTLDYLSSTEDGSDDLKSYIDQIENKIEEYGKEKYTSVYVCHVQGLNFRISKPIPWEIVNG